MKKLKLAFVAFLLAQSAITFAQEKSETVYFYAVGWEWLPQTEAAKLNTQPVVSNVVRINCNGYTSNSSLGVDNQLVEYYEAYHAKQRGVRSLNRTIAFGPYDTWDEAEKARRKDIADYNQKWRPLILQHFKYLCEED
ncbi:hypothetical protein [Parapedobacter sp. DT-150]|uniref:hypothetical protein n=1 Tax=Parapedobacter sp. DT-150 TaxID=3396162 RepID=UPI003F199483